MKQSSAIKNPEGTAMRFIGLLQVAFLSGMLGLLYYHVLGVLSNQWIHDANYSYGLLVPFFSGWVIWKRRDRLAAEPICPSTTGILLIVGAVAGLILGVVGAEDFLSRTSFLFLLAGLIVYFRGWQFFRHVLFPLAVLFLTIPLPTIVFNEIALPLQFEASRFASGLLSVVGVPVLREGNVIQLPSLKLEVAEACSGLRSLASLIALATLYGYLFEPRTWRRVLLVLAAVPLAVIANAARIAGTGILAEYWNLEKADGFYHFFAGLLIFLLTCGLLVAFHAAVSWVGSRRFVSQI